MVGKRGDRPRGCEDVGGSGSGRGRGEERIRDGAVGDDRFGTEDRGYNVAH